VGVVDESVEDGVGEGGVAEDVMPVVEGELAGDERGAFAVAIVEDFEEVATLGIGEGREPEVVEQKELSPGESVEELGIGSVGSGECELGEQAREPEVAGGQTVPTGAVSERAGEVALAGPCGSGDEDVVVLTDPLTRGEAEDERAVEAAGRAEVEVLDAGGHVELGDLEKPGEAAVVAEGDLALEQKSESVLEGEGVEIGHEELLLEGLGHPGEAELVEAIEGLVSQHGGSPWVESWA